MSLGRSLRFQVFLIILGTFLLMLILIHTTLYIALRSSTEFMANRTAEGLSRQVFSSMYQVMKRGWNRADLMEFLRSLEVSYAETPLSVNIYRGDKVKKLFGDVPEPVKSKLVVEAFSTKKGSSELKDQTHVSVFPVIARKECLRCHVNATEGDVLGVIESKIDLSPFYSNINRTMLSVAFFLFPLNFLIALVISSLVLGSLGKLRRSIEENVDRMRSIEDLRSISNLSKPPYTEFEELYSSLSKLAERIRDIAIDREVLDLESKLLERFIITSQLVNDWKEYIKTLVVDINEVVSVNVVFSIFIEDGFVDVEVFWLKEPYREQREVFERSLEREILSRLPVSVVGSRTVSVNHNFALVGEHFDGVDPDKFRLRTKTLILDRPHLGGIVGVGIESELMEDPYRRSVLDSVLATLVNVIGSAKAISSYVSEIEFYAMRDPLTFLYNQRTFWELLNYELERADRFGRNLSLLMLDLDNFKVINDTYGHAFGDKILREVARIVSEKKRKADVAARYGGDEFAIIAIGADVSHAVALARRMKEAIEGLSIPASEEDTITPQVSIGIATYPEHASTPRDLFILADSMLRKAKEEGRSRIRTPTLEDLQVSRVELTKKSILVLDSINKRLITPFFQPIVELSSGKTFANEVLMRIGERNIPASEFVETAENLGVIVRMDLILYEKALNRLVEEGYDRFIFMNLSSRALLSEDFLRNIIRIIDTSGFDSTKVVFELTERESVRNIELVEKFLRELKEVGTKFAIDDFGSGYSSFHYLKKIPVDFVKIEGEFVKGALSDWRDRTFIQSIVTLARGMNIKAVAEFIENKEIVEVLKDIGVDFGQGFYFGKPSPDPWI